MARRAGHPLVVLVSWSITVSMVLLVAWQWAESRSVRRAVPPIDASTGELVGWSTPILSARRAPGTLSGSLNASALRGELQPLADVIGSTSCLAVSLDGQPVVAVNADEPVMPASTLKVVVAAVALDVLGPNFRFTTSVHAEVGDDGVVAGDLVLVGGGDPVLTTDWWPTAGVQTYPPTDVTRLEDLADDVVAAGVTRVAGRVVGDGTRYDDEPYLPVWDEELRGTEVGPVGALLVDDGWITASRRDVTSDPALGAAQVFTSMLRARGITVGQGAAAEIVPFGPELTSISSAPLASIVREMLTTSDDNTAELLVREVGLAVSGTGTTAIGLGVVRDRLDAWDVPMDGVVLVDGSGLARTNTVTCRALLAVLHHAGGVEGPLGAGLPVAAATGTLSGEFVGTALADRLRAKTGTLSGVRALAGYVPVDGAAEIEVVLVLNAPGIEAGGYRLVWDGLLAPALATYPAAAGVDELSPG